MMARARRLSVRLRAEIEELTLKLIELGLADSYNTPVQRSAGGGTTVVSTPVPVDSSVLRASTYEELHRSQDTLGAFNIRFLDGALAQLTYTLVEDRLVTHRLAYLPSPDLLPYLTAPDLTLADTPFLEVVGAQVSGVPMRFDFDVRDGVPLDGVHPASHLTLGQYANCRIAAVGPVSPRAFFGLIVRAFYSTPELLPLEWDVLPVLAGFEATITPRESALIHIGVPTSGR